MPKRYPPELKRDVVHVARTSGLTHQRIAEASVTITWIERTYLRRRRQRALGKLTPIEFESLIGYNYRNEAA